MHSYMNSCKLNCIAYVLLRMTLLDFYVYSYAILVPDIHFHVFTSFDKQSYFHFLHKQRKGKFNVNFFLAFLCHPLKLNLCSMSSEQQKNFVVKYIRTIFFFYVLLLLLFPSFKITKRKSHHYYDIFRHKMAHTSTSTQSYTENMCFLKHFCSQHAKEISSVEAIMTRTLRPRQPEC